MPRIIESVEVVTNEGAGVYARSGYGGITDITENGGTFQFFNKAGELVMEIRNCPVVVRFREVEESEVT